MLAASAATTSAQRGIIHRVRMRGPFNGEWTVSKPAGRTATTGRTHRTSEISLWARFSATEKLHPSRVALLPRSPLRPVEDQEPARVPGARPSGAVRCDGFGDDPGPSAMHDRCGRFEAPGGHGPDELHGKDRGRESRPALAERRMAGAGGGRVEQRRDDAAMGLAERLTVLGTDRH